MLKQYCNGQQVCTQHLAAHDWLSWLQRLVQQAIGSMPVINCPALGCIAYTVCISAHAWLQHAFHST